jgi:hypothetical protein
VTDESFGHAMPDLPLGNFVHCTGRKAPVTRAPRSVVLSTRTGTMDDFPFAMRCERSSASFYSIPK